MQSGAAVYASRSANLFQDEGWFRVAAKEIYVRKGAAQEAGQACSCRIVWLWVLKWRCFYARSGSPKSCLEWRVSELVAHKSTGGLSARSSKGKAMSYAPPQFLAACPISFLESGRQSQLQQFSRVYVNEEGNQKQKKRRCLLFPSLGWRHGTRSTCDIWR